MSKRFKCVVCKSDLSVDYQEKSSLTGIMKVCRYCVTMQMARNREAEPKPQGLVNSYNWTNNNYIRELDRIELDGKHGGDYSLHPKIVVGTHTKFKGRKPVCRLSKKMPLLKI